MPRINNVPTVTTRDPWSTSEVSPDAPRNVGPVDSFERVGRSVAASAVATSIPVPVPRRGLASAGRRKDFQKKSQVPGIVAVRNLRESLNVLPGFIRDQAMEMLNNDELLEAVLKDPDVLVAIAHGDEKAVELVAKNIESWVRWGAFEAAVNTGLISHAEGALKAIAKPLKENDQIRYGLLFAVENDIPIGDILEDIRTEKLDSQMLARFMDGEPKASDLATVYHYILEKAGGELYIDAQNPTFQKLLDTFPLPENINTDAIKSIYFGRGGDKIVLQLNDGEPLIASFLFDVNVAGEIVFDVEAIEEEGKGRFALRLRRVGGEMIKAAFVDLHMHLTGSSGFDRFLEILVKIILAPVFLAVGVVYEFMNTDYEVSNSEQAKQKALEARNNRDVRSTGTVRESNAA